MLRNLIVASALSLPALAQNPAPHPTAQQIIDRIKAEVGVAPTSQTVDTFKAGDPSTPVTKIAVTMMATFDVLQRAAAQGANLVITHEPTFYNHEDATDELSHAHDPVLSEKQKFIADHGMVIWRFHDGWHARRPDGILLGMAKTLGWQTYQSPADPNLFTVPEQSLDTLAFTLQRTLQSPTVRVVGDPKAKISHVALLPGAAGSPQQEKLLERPDVQVLVIGETREWETVEYTADAASEHKHKALIILGHIPSEQAGMEECVHWLKTFITDVPVAFVPAKQPFWTPSSVH